MPSFTFLAVNKIKGFLVALRGRIQYRAKCVLSRNSYNVTPGFFTFIDLSHLAAGGYSSGAIVRRDFPGFYEDYLAIHCILRRYSPANILEIGTSSGTGTNIICKAMGDGKVISIDLPPEYNNEMMYPQHEDGKPAKPGVYCTFPYRQLFGNSKDFDFSPHYPLEAWFIDGKHNYEYATADTRQALKSSPALIIWHDVQMKEVAKAIRDIMTGTEYHNYYVANTRVAFSARKKLD